MERAKDAEVAIGLPQHVVIEEDRSLALPGNSGHHHAHKAWWPLLGQVVT